jgi:murein DD-endopeptidase MepM/ murein hydrolase activator NlpD
MSHSEPTSVRSRARRLAFLLVLSLVVAAAPSTGLAGPVERQREIATEKAMLRQKIRDADRQSQSLSQQIAGSDRRRAALEREISALSQELADAEARIVTAEASLNAARTELFTIEGSLSEALGKLDDLRTKLDSRVRETYKAGSGPYLDFLLSAKGFRDFVARIAFVRTVVSADRRHVLAADEAARQLASARNDAIQQKTDIEAQKAAVEAEKLEITRLQADVRAKRQQVLGEIAHRQQLLTQVQNEKAQYLRQVEQLDRESRSIAEILRSRQRGQVYQVGSGVRLAWPTTGSVVSGFGYRTHPIFGDRRLHSGIDISAPAGQAVVASEAGWVVLAGPTGGYGLAVLIDHGGGLATLYAHLSSVRVTAGVRVARGTPIGAVGCTGYCTGPHLHYETRVNGEPVDPMRFF